MDVVKYFNALVMGSLGKLLLRSRKNNTHRHASYTENIDHHANTGGIVLLRGQIERRHCRVAFSLKAIRLVSNEVVHGYKDSTGVLGRTCLSALQSCIRFL